MDQGRYFRLMGRIAAPGAPPEHTTQLSPTDPDASFVIGRGATITARRSGRLWVFANDGWDRYGNNWGHVTLTVRRVPAG